MRNLPDFSPNGHDGPRALVVIGRAGLAARGIVYLTVGALAAMAGLGIGNGKLVDQKGAVRALSTSSPYGDVVLWVIAIGLACYVLWRFSQVVLAGGPEFKGAKGMGKRAVALVSGLAYASLSFTAFAQALGRARSGKGDGAQQQGAAWLISQPLGQWLVGVVAALIAGAAIAQFARAYTASFTKHLRGGGLTADQELWARRAGRAGFAARGVAFALVAWFFAQAALQNDAGEAGGLAAVLQTLRRNAPAPHSSSSSAPVLLFSARTRWSKHVTGASGSLPWKRKQA
jgi:hypothetical protein